MQSVRLYRVEPHCAHPACLPACLSAISILLLQKRDPCDIGSSRPLNSPSLQRLYHPPNLYPAPFACSPIVRSLNFALRLLGCNNSGIERLCRPRTATAASAAPILGCCSVLSAVTDVIVCLHHSVAALSEKRGKILRWREDIGAAAWPGSVAEPVTIIRGECSVTLRPPHPKT